MTSISARPDGPLLVFGPRSLAYDFGPGHPLTPRRFGPGIDLLVTVGARPGLAPEPAADEELLRCHTASYLAAVRRLSRDPSGPPEAGIGPGDDPPFAGMHEAGAAVAGGSLRAVEAILRGDADHAFHPGGGLHHAMPGSASGFCIYNDPALAIARARLDGLRVLYVDLDVHHGDGVQAIHLADPGVLTVSFHESGRYLFPGTGFVDELGAGVASGTAVNVPFDPSVGERAWLAAVGALVPALTAAFGPDLLVSQHGADSHAWDPLAHLRVTTTAMGAAARLVDAVAHRYARGRWLATGGGGYDAYRVVPRAWALTWLAGAHREVPGATPVAWRERWAAEAARYGQAPLPERFDDEPNAGRPVDAAQDAAEARAAETVALVRMLVLPRLVREAIDRGWWRPLEPVGGGRWDRRVLPGGPTIVAPLEPGMLDRLVLAPRVVPPADPVEAVALLRAALISGARAAAAIAGNVIVGLVLAAPAGADPSRDALVALGVAPSARRRGLGACLLRALVSGQPPGRPMEALVTAAERDPFDPLPDPFRREIARRLLERAGFAVRAADGAVGRADPHAIEAVRRG